jgi:hypothetical protein
MTLGETLDEPRPGAGSSAKVRLRGLTKCFWVKGRRVDALAGVDLDVQVFGRPRVVEVVKSSAQYGELFGRVWGQLRDEVQGTLR